MKNIRWVDNHTGCRLAACVLICINGTILNQKEIIFIRTLFLSIVLNPNIIFPCTYDGFSIAKNHFSFSIFNSVFPIAFVYCFVFLSSAINLPILIWSIGSCPPFRIYCMDFHFAFIPTERRIWWILAVSTPRRVVIYLGKFKFSVLIISYLLNF